MFVLTGLVAASATLGAFQTVPLSQVPRSQEGGVSQRVADTDLSVTYSRPVARGRELFGVLVPYGRVWHPGANQATKLTISRDITIAEHGLPAGSYSIWILPTPDQWTVIFSRAADVFHTPYPGEAHDALRVGVTPETTPHTEVLTWDFPMVDGKDTSLRLRWGTVAVAMPIAVP